MKRLRLWLIRMLVGENPSPYKTGPSILIRNFGPMRSQWFTLPNGVYPPEIEYQLTEVSVETRNKVLVLRLEEQHNYVLRNSVGCASCKVEVS